MRNNGVVPVLAAAAGLGVAAFGQVAATNRSAWTQFNPVTRLTAASFAHPPAADLPWVRMNMPATADPAEIQAEVHNTGNVTTEFAVAALEPTRVLDCEAEPPTVIVPPGQMRSVTIFAKGPRPWFSQTVARSLQITAASSNVTLEETARFNQRRSGDARFLLSHSIEKIQRFATSESLHVPVSKGPVHRIPQEDQ